MNTIKIISLLLIMSSFVACDSMDYSLSNVELAEGNIDESSNETGSTDNPNCPYNNSGSSDDDIREEPDGTTTYNEGMVAHYPMDRGGLDISIHANHGALEGNTTNYDGEIQLDGRESRLIALHQPHLNFDKEFTVSAMIRPEAMKAQTLVRKGEQPNGLNSLPFALELSSSGYILFSLSDDESDFHQLQYLDYNVDVWIQITGVFLEEEMRLYVDGELVSSKEIKGTPSTNSKPLLIGTRTYGWSNSTVEGSIDEVRLYDRALNENDIKQLYLNLRKD